MCAELLGDFRGQDLPQVLSDEFFRSGEGVRPSASVIQAVPVAVELQNHVGDGVQQCQALGFALPDLVLDGFSNGDLFLEFGVDLTQGGLPGLDDRGHLLDSGGDSRKLGVADVVERVRVVAFRHPVDTVPEAAQGSPDQHPEDHSRGDEDHGQGAGQHRKGQVSQPDQLLVVGVQANEHLDLPDRLPLVDDVRGALDAVFGPFMPAVFEQRPALLVEDAKFVYDVVQKEVGADLVDLLVVEIPQRPGQDVTEACREGVGLFLQFVAHEPGLVDIDVGEQRGFHQKQEKKKAEGQFGGKGSFLEFQHADSFRGAAAAPSKRMVSLHEFPIRPVGFDFVQCPLPGGNDVFRCFEGKGNIILHGPERKYQLQLLRVIAGLANDVRHVEVRAGPEIDISLNQMTDIAEVPVGADQVGESLLPQELVLCIVLVSADAPDLFGLIEGRDAQVRPFLRVKSPVLGVDRSHPLEQFLPLGQTGCGKQGHVGPGQGLVVSPGPGDHRYRVRFAEPQQDLPNQFDHPPGRLAVGKVVARRVFLGVEGQPPGDQVLEIFPGKPFGAQRFEGPIPLHLVQNPLPAFHGGLRGAAGHGDVAVGVLPEGEDPFQGFGIHARLPGHLRHSQVVEKPKVHPSGGQLLDAARRGLGAVQVCESVCAKDLLPYVVLVDGDGRVAPDVVDGVEAMAAGFEGVETGPGPVHRAGPIERGPRAPRCAPWQKGPRWARSAPDCSPGPRAPPGSCPVDPDGPEFHARWQRWSRSAGRPG